MAIGVTYTSANGQTSSFSAEGASSVSEQIRQLQSMPMTNEAYHQLKELRRQKREERKAAHGFAEKAKEFGRGAANFVKSLIGFGSSIEEKNGKLQLVGDSFAVKNGDVYGKGKEGTKGFFPLTELLEFLDKREEGAVVGAGQSDDDNEQSDGRDKDSDSAFAVTVVSRVGVAAASETEDESDIKRSVIVYGRDVYFTGRGRAFKVGAERELCTFPTVGAGGGLGEVTVTGTDGESVTGTSFKFETEPDSNVTVKFIKDEETGEITAKVGVYWWDGYSREVQG